MIRLLCVLLFLTACSPAGEQSLPAASTAAAGATLPAPDVSVRRGRVVKTLSFTARVAPVEEHQLYFKSAGYVKEVYFRQGDPVSAGDLLARLEADDLLNQIAQAEVALNSAQLLLSEAQESLLRQIDQAQLDLAVAQASLRQAERANAHAVQQAELALQAAREQLPRIRALQATYDASVIRARVNLDQSKETVRRAEIQYKESLDRPWEPQETRDSFAYALQQARWNLDIAQAEYEQALADQQVYQHDLNIQQIAIDQSRLHLEQLNQGVDQLLELEVQRAQADLEYLHDSVDPALVNQVNQAQLALERLQRQLTNARVVAPVDGTVIWTSLYPGRAVEAYRVVLILADPQAIELTANLSDEHMQTLSEGQPATLSLTEDAARAWQTSIRCLPYPYGTCGTTENLAGSDAAVRLHLPHDTDSFSIGDRVDVSIVLDARDDVLYLPPAAIRHFQGRHFVILRDGATQRRVDVELGIEGQDQVEILNGLQEGQWVVVP